MKIIVETLAKSCLDNIFNYNMQYSSKNALEVDKNIRAQINNLNKFSYLGKLIPEMSDSHFREIIYKKSRHSGYRIMYFVSDYDNSIHIFNIINSKQKFSSFKRKAVRISLGIWLLWWYKNSRYAYTKTTKKAKLGWYNSYSL